MAEPYKVLIVDDSPTVRRVFRRILSADPELRVVGEAADPFEARDLVVDLQPDVLTLDIEMPRMDGLTFLRRLMHHYPLPVVILSSLTERGGAVALEAFRAGAAAVLPKPGEDWPLEQMAGELVVTVKAVARAHSQPVPPRRPVAMRAITSSKVIALGASTGGTVALERVLESMPEGSPPILVVQHMPAAFTESFAARLDSRSTLSVREAKGGERLRPGLVLVAPGGRHMLLQRTALGLSVLVKQGPLVNGHRPSVDVLFRSVAKAVGAKGVGALLTGMGSDGALGLLEMRRAGAATFAQDERSCAVFGMPKAAIELGAAAQVVELDHLAGALLAGLEEV